MNDVVSARQHFMYQKPVDSLGRSMASFGSAGSRPLLSERGAWLLPGGLAVASVGVALWHGNRRLQLRSVAKKLEIQGHRCYGDYEPHNTLRSTRAAAADREVRSVEFDVRRTRDGHIVVTHGPEAGASHGKSPGSQDLSRLESLTLAEAQSVDIGKGERVPLLADLVDICLTAGLIMNVELKDAWEAKHAS